MVRTDGRDTLNDPVRGVQCRMFVRHDLQSAGDSGYQFTGPQKKFRVRRPAVFLLADAERLVDEDAIGRDRCNDIGQDRAPEIVRDNDAVVGGGKKR